MEKQMMNAHVLMFVVGLLVLGAMGSMFFLMLGGMAVAALLISGMGL